MKKNTDSRDALDERIDQLLAKQTLRPSENFPEETLLRIKTTSKRNIIFHSFQWIALAASILILASISYLIIQKDEGTLIAEVYTDQEYLEYEELLLMNESLIQLAELEDYSNLPTVFSY